MAVLGWHKRWAVPAVVIASPLSWRAERLFARQRSKYRPRTTDSQHGGPIAPNRLQNLTVRKPDHVWVTDATCVLTDQGWLYLVAVLDLCTRRVVGWAMHQILDARLVMAALRMALLQRRPPPSSHRPLRPRSAICQRRLPTAPCPARPGCLHEPQRMLIF